MHLPKCTYCNVVHAMESVGCSFLFLSAGIHLIFSATQISRVCTMMAHHLDWRKLCTSKVPDIRSRSCIKSAEFGKFTLTPVMAVSTNLSLFLHSHFEYFVPMPIQNWVHVVLCEHLQIATAIFIRLVPKIDHSILPCHAWQRAPATHLSKQFSRSPSEADP